MLFDEEGSISSLIKKCVFFINISELVVLDDNLNQKHAIPISSNSKNLINTKHNLQNKYKEKIDSSVLITSPSIHPVSNYIFGSRWGGKFGLINYCWEQNVSKMDGGDNSKQNVCWTDVLWTLITLMIFFFSTGFGGEAVCDSYGWSFVHQGVLSIGWKFRVF